MNSLSLRAPWLCALPVAAAAAAASSPVIAAAQDCTADADCGAGYRCQTNSYESCGGAITCSSDGGCTEAPGECETVAYSWCTNATCKDDADCPSSMACRAQTTWQCDGGAAGGGSGSVGAGGAAGSSLPVASAGSECPLGEMCRPPDPIMSSCVEVPADSLCIPRYQLPCTQASDCGGGFDCLQAANWECSGGLGAETDAGVESGDMTTAPSSGGSGGAAGAPSGMDADGGVAEPPDECHAVPSTDFYCQLQDLPCSADDECPEGLKCQDRYFWTCNGSGTGGAGSAGMGASGAPAPVAVAMDADAGVSDGSDCTTQTQQRCMPPDYGGSASGDNSGGSMGGGGYADAGVAEPPAAAGSGSTGNSGPGAGGAGGGPATGGGDSHGESDDDHDHGHHLGWLKLGCSAGGPIGADPSGWLALGMVTLLLRRRARRS